METILQEDWSIPSGPSADTLASWVGTRLEIRENLLRVTVENDVVSGETLQSRCPSRIASATEHAASGTQISPFDPSAMFPSAARKSITALRLFRFVE